MESMLFCNIGWMSRYEGLVGKPDKIVGGGSYVTENETGNEVCNFVACRDGYVYGHVEISKGKMDRKIRIEAANFSLGSDVSFREKSGRPAQRRRTGQGCYRGGNLAPDLPPLAFRRVASSHLTTSRSGQPFYRVA